jgi:tubulin monoglycylase TTLL3/8
MKKELLIKHDEKLIEKSKTILETIKLKSAQYYLNGNKNIWIMKPSGLSRGRGIKCINSLGDVLGQVKGGCNQFVIQKYIENPLVIKKKKVMNYIITLV